MVRHWICVLVKEETTHCEPAIVTVTLLLELDLINLLKQCIDIDIQFE